MLLLCALIIRHCFKPHILKFIVLSALFKATHVHKIPCIECIFDLNYCFWQQQWWLASISSSAQWCMCRLHCIFTCTSNCQSIFTAIYCLEYSFRHVSMFSHEFMKQNVDDLKYIVLSQKNIYNLLFILLNLKKC